MWEMLKLALIEKGYSLYQMQYSYKHHEGFHAWMSKEDSQVEVITHEESAEENIVKINS